MPATTPMLDRLASTGRLRPMLSVFALIAVILLVVCLRLEGRRWWCRLGDVGLCSSGIASEHTSQHVLDPYSLTHIFYGVLLYAALRLARPRLGWDARLLGAILLETLWEVVENSPPFVARYRAATIAVGYVGDSVANSLGDMISCVVGILLAGRLPTWGSIALVAAVEVGLLLTVRDSLLLNVLMIVHPVEAIRAWQGG